MAQPTSSNSSYDDLVLPDITGALDAAQELYSRYANGFFTRQDLSEEGNALVSNLKTTVART